MEPVVLEGFDIEIDRSEVLRLLGRREGAGKGAGERLEQVLDEALSLAVELIEPRGLYKVTAGCDLPGSTMFEDLEMVAFCICTIGPGLEKEVTALSGKGELLRAVVLDSVGSAAAEAVAGYIDGRIGDEASRKGLRTSCRSSPGYGDWDIREQESIFRLLPGARIGVRLSEGCMMIPRKSISFAVHIAESPARMRSENSCRNCDREDCPYRILE